MFHFSVQFWYTLVKLTSETGARRQFSEIELFHEILDFPVGPVFGGLLEPIVSGP